MQVEIRVQGPVGPTIATALADEVDVQMETILVGPVADDEGVHGLLGRLHNLGLSVVEVHVRRADGEPG